MIANSVLIQMKEKPITFQDLKAELKSEISGNFEKLVLDLLETPVNYDAKELKGAIKVFNMRSTKFPLLDSNLCLRCYLF